MINLRRDGEPFERASRNTHCRRDSASRHKSARTLPGTVRTLDGLRCSCEDITYLLRREVGVCFQHARYGAGDEWGRKARPLDVLVMRGNEFHLGYAHFHSHVAQVAR